MSDVNCLYCGSDDVIVKYKADSKAIVICNDCGKSEGYGYYI